MKRYCVLIVIGFYALIPFKSLTAQGDLNYQTFIDHLPTVNASVSETPPDWAIMQRSLIDYMEQAAPYYVDRFTRRGSTTYGEGPYDDLYEMFYNWPELYAIGGDKYLLNRAIEAYNAITRSSTSDGQLYKEFPKHTDIFHLSEGYTLFTNLGLGDPTIPENVDRARRFAGFYLNEDEEALNYDYEHKIIRSNHTGSQGVDNSVNGDYMLIYGHASLYPIVKNLEPNWNEDPERRREIRKLYNQIVTRTDVPTNLGVIGLVTNAYLYTGDQKYKDWILGYVDAWMKRIEENDGMLPDNIGQTGEIGEYRNGQWWGGLFGWQARYSHLMIYASLSVASESAYLLSGDESYLNFLRSQLTGLMERGKTTPEGQFLVPFRMSKEGWTSYRPMMVRDLAHLWHASMAKEDWQKIEKLMKGKKFHPLAYDDDSIWGTNTPDHKDKKVWEASEPFDWSKEVSMGDRTMGVSEHPRLMYYAGKNPDWPFEALKADLRQSMKRIHFMRNDSRDIKEINGDDLYPNNPVLTKALVQTTMGAPQSIYFGGFNRARVRYFNIDLKRPGLPDDVAALVEGLEADRTQIHLVNLSPTETRRLIVQAGAFGEHSFTNLSYRGERFGEQENEHARFKDKTTFTEQLDIQDRYFAVELPPGASVRLNIGTKRFVNKPTYAFPWHGGEVPLK